MAGAQDDQTAFARAARKLLAALDLAEAEVDAEPDDSTEEGEDGGEQSGQQDNSQDGEGQSESEPDSMLGAQPEEMEGEAADDEPATTPRRTPPPPKATTGPAARSRAASGPTADNERRYRAYTRAVRRGDRRRGSVRPR